MGKVPVGSPRTQPGATTVLAPLDLPPKDPLRIPCVLMRGGTSRVPFFLERDLPSDPQARDRVLLAAMGSPHQLQVDGVGGGDPLTSKVAIIGAPTHPLADLDYLFA